MRHLGTHYFIQKKWAGYYYPAHLCPSPIIFKMPRTTRTQGKRWVFTHNNYSAEDETRIQALFQSDDVKYGVYGREVGESGTRHLQGFIVFIGNKRFNAVRRLFPRAHIEQALGTSQQARDYCKKDGDFFEAGTFPGASGNRTDLDALFRWGDEFTEAHGRGPTSPEVARAQPEAYLRYPRVVRLFQARAPAPSLREGTPNEWQNELEQELEDQADDRSIVFYVDEEGGKGKTWFQQYYLTKYPDQVQILSVGKRDDLAYAIDETKRIFFFNVPRDGMQFFQYTIAEQLKDRMVFSTKYQSRLKVLPTTPHVIVFANEQPDDTKLSADRVVIRNLE